MLLTRVIPALLIQEGRLVKGRHFQDHRYVGDPMNAIRIFNAKEVDELMLLDIGATDKRSLISADLIRKVSKECLMPITVGGGVRTLEDAWRLFNAGAEKIAVCTAALDDPPFVRALADKFGSQSVVVSIDVRRLESGGYGVFSHSGKKPRHRDPVSFAREMEAQGAGEILLNSIDRDGTMEGYDLGILAQVSQAVSIPTIALGGCGAMEHFADAIKVGHATALAAGSYFVFYGRRRAVLISFPSRGEIERALAQ